MPFCDYCGGEITFRYVDGRNTPIHLSGGCWGESSASYTVAPAHPVVQERVLRAVDHWRRGFSRSDSKEPLAYPTRCPICDDFIFFHTNGNGDAVFFDTLGPPWPKHPCLTMEQTRIVAATSQSLMNIVSLKTRPASIPLPDSSAQSGTPQTLPGTFDSFGIVLSAKKDVVYLLQDGTYIRKRIEGQRIVVCVRLGQKVTMFAETRAASTIPVGQLVRFSARREVLNGREGLLTTTFELFDVSDDLCADQPIKMSHWWIEPAKILGGSNPSIEDLRRIHQWGFNTVVSLLHEREQNPNYDTKALDAIGVVRHSIPIKDFAAPTLHQMIEFFRIVDSELSKGRIFVHCQGGSGRTGTMGAAYWIQRGMSAADAIRRIRESRPNTIETLDQEQCLLELQESLKKDQTDYSRNQS